MNELIEETREDFLAPVLDGEVTPEHRAWMNAQIRLAVKRKRDGTASYKSLDEIRQKYGF